MAVQLAAACSVDTNIMVREQHEQADENNDWRKIEHDEQTWWLSKIHSQNEDMRKCMSEQMNQMNQVILFT